jgi:exosortase/archaeosortase family protein
VKKGRKTARPNRAKSKTPPGASAGGWWAGRKILLRFTVAFLCLIAAFFALSLAPFWGLFEEKYLKLNAQSGNALLNLLSQGCHVSGTSIASGHFAMAVKPECASGGIISFLCAAFLAFPYPLGRRLIGAALGIAAIALLNVVRIASVFLVGVHQPRLFEAVHEELWPGLIIMTILLLMLVWIRWVLRSGVDAQKSKRDAPFFAVRFALVFCLLIIPWPGLSDLCGTALRGLGSAAFTRAKGPREVAFESLDAHTTRAVIVNRTLKTRDGTRPMRNLDLNSCGFLWRPLCLLFALIFATPLSLRRQLLSLAIGGYLLLGFLVLALAFALWNESTEVSLATLSPPWKNFAGNFQTTLMQLATLVAPVLIWLWAVFPRLHQLSQNIDSKPLRA